MPRAPSDVRVLMIDDVDEEIEEEADGDSDAKDAEWQRAAPDGQDHACGCGNQSRSKTQDDAGQRIVRGNRIQRADIHDPAAGSVDVFERVGQEDCRGHRNAAGERRHHQIGPEASRCQRDQLVSGNNRSDHDGDERTHQKRRPQQQAGEQIHAERAVVSRVNEQRDARQAHRPRRGVLRLVQEDPLQAVDLQASELPVADRVDVHRAQALERHVSHPERVQLLNAFEAAQEHRRNASERRGRRAVDELADEEIEERDECQIEAHRIDQQDRLEGQPTARGAILDARQQVGQPVVVHVVAGEKRIARRHVALADFRRDRHGPFEIGDEIRAIQFAFGTSESDVRVRQADHARNEEQDNQKGRQIASIERRNGQRWCQALCRDCGDRRDRRRDGQRGGASHAGRPHREQHQACRGKSPCRADERGRHPAARRGSEQAACDNDAGQRGVHEHDRERRAGLESCDSANADAQGNDQRRSCSGRQPRTARRVGTSCG